MHFLKRQYSGFDYCVVLNIVLTCTHGHGLKHLGGGGGRGRNCHCHPNLIPRPFSNGHEACEKRPGTRLLPFMHVHVSVLPSCTIIIIGCWD